MDQSLYQECMKILLSQIVIQELDQLFILLCSLHYLKIMNKNLETRKINCLNNRTKSILALDLKC